MKLMKNKKNVKMCERTYIHVGFSIIRFLYCLLFGYH